MSISLCSLIILNKFVTSIKETERNIILHDVPNLTVGGNRQIYISNVISKTNPADINIFVLNNDCSDELNLGTYNNITIIDNDLPYFYIVTPNSIECDDKTIIYISYLINNKDKVSIISNDDYTRDQHERIAVDLQVYYDLGLKEKIIKNGLHLSKNSITRIPQVSHIYTSFDEFIRNNERIQFYYNENPQNNNLKQPLALNDIKNLGLTDKHGNYFNEYGEYIIGNNAKYNTRDHVVDNTRVRPRNHTVDNTLNNTRAYARYDTVAHAKDNTVDNTVAHAENKFHTTVNAGNMFYPGNKYHTTVNAGNMFYPGNKFHTRVKDNKDHDETMRHKYLKYKNKYIALKNLYIKKTI